MLIDLVLCWQPPVSCQLDSLNLLHSVNIGTLIGRRPPCKCLAQKVLRPLGTPSATLQPRGRWREWSAAFRSFYSLIAVRTARIHRTQALRKVITLREMGPHFTNVCPHSPRTRAKNKSGSVTVSQNQTRIFAKPTATFLEESRTGILQEQCSRVRVSCELLACAHDDQRRCPCPPSDSQTTTVKNQFYTCCAVRCTVAGRNFGQPECSSGMRSRRHQCCVRNATISRAAKSQMCTIHVGSFCASSSRDLQFSFGFSLLLCTQKGLEWTVSLGRLAHSSSLCRLVSFLATVPTRRVARGPFPSPLRTFRLLSTLSHYLLSQHSVHENYPHPSGGHRLSIPST